MPQNYLAYRKFTNWNFKNGYKIHSEKTYLKAGFKREGVLRDAIMNNGIYADKILMSILEDKWKAPKQIRRKCEKLPD